MSGDILELELVKPTDEFRGAVFKERNQNDSSLETEQLDGYVDTVIKAEKTMDN